MQRTHLVRLGIGALLIAAVGFAVSGLSRLVVSTTAALTLGAPFIVGGFLLAVATFVLAALVSAGILQVDDPASSPDESA